MIAIKNRAGHIDLADLTFEDLIHEHERAVLHGPSEHLAEMRAELVERMGKGARIDESEEGLEATSTLHSGELLHLYEWAILVDYQSRDNSTAYDLDELRGEILLRV